MAKFILSVELRLSGDNREKGFKKRTVYPSIKEAETKGNAIMEKVAKKQGRVKWDKFGLHTIYGRVIRENLLVCDNVFIKITESMENDDFDDFIGNNL